MHLSKSIALIVYVAMIILLATSTLLTSSIYGTWWFFTAWVLIAIFLIGAIIKYKMWQRLASMLLHCSFLLILAGGATTYILGEKGHIILRQGESTSQFVLEGSDKTASLPAEIRLDSFEIVHYPGSLIPRDYVSHLSVNSQKHIVSMNNIADISGYRIYQSSFDNSGSSVLSINHDPWGIHLTYGGYIAFGLAALLMLIASKGKFRSYLRKASLVIACLVVPCLSSNAASIKGIPVEDAKKMSTRQVLYNGRIAPFNTLAHDFVTKITGSSSFGTLIPEQVVASWVLYPDDWKNQPFILIKSAELRNELGIESKYASYNQLFTSTGEYRLKSLYTNSSEGLDRDILEVDEKVELIYLLLNNQLIKPLPQNMEPISESRINAEIFYNNVPFAKFFFMATLSLSVIFLVVVIWQKRANAAMPIVASILLTFQLIGYSLKWYIAQSIPLSNGPETMQFLSIFILFIALILYRRNQFILPLAMLLAGFFGLVAHIGSSNPTITPLVPVLNSPWLSIHVSVIMISYAFLALTMLISIIALCVKSEQERLMWLNKALLYPGVFLLSAGIFLGAVWANVSWGRYWGWDPKEVWALITMLIYAIPMHSSLIPLFNRPKPFHIFIILSFLSVLFTYFGVNYLLGGLHSYA